MRNNSHVLKPLVTGIAILVATTVASGGDKKPAAVAASTSGGAAASAKPAAVQKSTAKAPTFATHLDVKSFSVHLEKVSTAQWGDQWVARSLAQAKLTVEGRGQQVTFAGSEKQKNDPRRYDGLTAFQILVEQGCFVHQDGYGFILLDTCKDAFVRKTDDKQKRYDRKAEGEADQGNSTGKSFMGSDGKLDIKTDAEKEAEKNKMVDPDNTEGVAKEPGQFGTPGLFGQDWTVDEDCMAGRSKMYSECVDRCKDAGLGSVNFGECTEKCSKDARGAYGDCEGAAPRWEEN